MKANAINTETSNFHLGVWTMGWFRRHDRYIGMRPSRQRPLLLLYVCPRTGQLRQCIRRFILAVCDLGDPIVDCPGQLQFEIRSLKVFNLTSEATSRGVRESETRTGLCLFAVSTLTTVVGILSMY
jgi:hypothetical protein